MPFTELRAMVDSARGSRVEVYAQNMHQEPEGAFTGEISPPMLSELDVRGWCSGTPSAGSIRRDRPGARAEGAGRARGGAAPILCVGETEEERDNDETERKLRQQVRRTSRGCRASAWRGGDRL